MTGSELQGAAENARWYVANTRPHAEKLALVHLRRQGFRGFLPTCAGTIRHARQFRDAETPLFPGYIFVGLDLARDRWRAINGTQGVVALVAAGNEPAAVPRGIVEALQAMSTAAGLIGFEHEMRVGQRVRMIAGPFADALGRLEHMDAQGRVRVLLDMMGTVVRVTAQSRHLAPV